MVTNIQGMEERKDEDVLFGAFDSAYEVWMRGVGKILGSEL